MRDLKLSLNHLEGRTAAFFSYTDGGANERDAFAPPVWQCRFGVEVPDAPWQHAEFGAGKPSPAEQQKLGLSRD